MAKNARSAWAAKLGDVPAGTTASATRLGVAKAAAGDLRLGARFSGRVLGIDPSLRGTGLAVVTLERGQPVGLVASRTVKINPKEPEAVCYGLIASAVAEYIADFAPQQAAIEDSVFVQNQRIALKIGASRGAALAPVAQASLHIGQYPPSRVKAAVGASGRAGKDQIAGIVRQLLNLPEPLPWDESDAAAVAMCHGFTWRETGHAVQ